jgi:uncharacterized DUF497 family protein
MYHIAIQWNTDHIAHHQVTPEEVNEACQNNPSVRQTYDDRVLAIGPTHKDRLLAIVLAPKDKEHTYYVVTAWPASGKLRRFYDQEQGKEKIL